MNLNKYESYKTNQKETDNSKKLPVIKKIIPIRTIFERSSQSFSNLIPTQNIYYFNHKNPPIHPRDKINTKLYKVNDYLSMTYKNINIYSPINNLNETRNKKDFYNFKSNTSDINQDTRKLLPHFYRNNSTQDFNISSSTNQNSNVVKINLYNNSQQRSNFNRSVNSLYNNDSLKSFNTINSFNIHKKYNDERIKKINNYNLNILKNSKYFNKTKYFNGIKNKIKINQNLINKSLSTKNLSLENTRNTSNQKNYSDIRVEELLNKRKNINETNKKITNNEDNNNIKKTEEIGVETDNEKTNNAIFYDFIPIILQHMKQKEIIDEINKDHENAWLYDKIKTLYNNNSSQSTKGKDQLKLKNKKDLLENPIIKYLFLEKTLYNLKHIVNFVDIKNREEFEQKVLKVIGEEYSKIQDKQNIYDINDFTTYGYEFDPKLLIKFKQLNMEKQLLLDSEKIKNDMQNKVGTKTTINRKKNEFFTTNKYDFKTDERKKNKKESNEKSSSEGGGLLSKIMLANFGINKNIRNFGGIKESNIEKKRTIFNNDKNKESPLNNNIISNNQNNHKDNIISNEKKEGGLENDGNIIENKENEQKEELINNKVSEEDKKLVLTQDIQNTGTSHLPQNLLKEDIKDVKDKNYNTIKDKEKFNPNRNSIDIKDITHLVNDIQSKDKIKKRHGDKYLKIYSIQKKKIKKKKKVNISESLDVESKEEEEIPPVNFDSIDNGITLPAPEEEKKEEPKKEIIIKNKFDYERYKREKIKQNELDKRSKSLLFAAIKKQDGQKVSLKKDSLFNELYYSSNYKKNNPDEYDNKKKYEKNKKIDERNEGEIGGEEEEEEKEKEEEEEEEGDEFEDISQIKQIDKTNKDNSEEEVPIVSEISSEIENLDQLDINEDMENNDIMKKKWMENSPKFKNRIIDYNRRRYGIFGESNETLSHYIRKGKIEALNDKMNKLYDKLDKKRKAKELKKKKKKRKFFSFEGIDLTSVDAIEKKKKVFLNRIKEDIKYKINEGKYHLLELENFKHFEEAMNKFKLRNTSEIKKVKIYVNLVEKYLHYYQVELDNREKEKYDEDRINMFLRNLHREVYVTLPYVKEVKGRYCHSVDFFKKLQELSDYYDF